MRVSSRGHYGLRAMVELAKGYGQGPIALSEIAQSEQIPSAYLEQLIARLRRAGLVESTRGIHGGYRLALEPARVTVGKVLRVLEGPMVLIECLSETPEGECCDREADCASRQVWQRMRDSIAQVLDSTTLADLCREEETRPREALGEKRDSRPHPKKEKEGSRC